MDHKAFVFDYDAFRNELHDALVAALHTGNVAHLRSFISQHRDELTDPYEGAPLGDDWEAQVDAKDPHQYGDFALTKYYRVVDNLGLGPDWQHAEELLAREGIGEALLLGCTIDSFDPGKQGSYVQSPAMVIDGLAKIDALLARSPELAGELGPVRALFATAVARHRGLYITF